MSYLARSPGSVRLMNTRPHPPHQRRHRYRDIHHDKINEYDQSRHDKTMGHGKIFSSNKSYY
ncbi:UNVERIFIED_CONTAM: hypothetical protein DV101_02880 [Bifidobacterium animalis]|uniref:Uncharacterized protein n=1 Tax=Bifidobacterium animalis subsp. lactis CNCM I-2494 TaxID=1042403 RepID=A0A806FJQ0_BIFAN|nr:hypothetical protein BALAC2494_01939 [Bifidobacterium animalis subsp. lactis CNCM I-2494]AXM93849.1 hypothetical protein CJD49_06065 [Bifidobacterium animalis subsp. lactis]KAB5634466.1 hypothetical protein GBA51_01580 [Bifidobacterium animalis]PIN31458.1 hypothetical protein CUC13_07790 [Bifidobacterium animalis subsp. lactis BB-12]AXQ18247.1 hypothetical protein D0Y52_05215 [Bifidobacterium animalis subsp. lactis]